MPPAVSADVEVPDLHASLVALARGRREALAQVYDGKARDRFANSIRAIMAA